MRTTIDIEDDVLSAAKDLAQRQRKTIGQVVSELARRGLAGPMAPARREPKTAYGFRPFSGEARLVSNELIQKLREDGEY